jgi:hypothetical protein
MTAVGTCPACHRPYTLTDNGTLPLHLEKQANGFKPSPPCAGVGQSPAERAAEK